MSRKNCLKKQLQPKLSATVAAVTYCIGVPDPISGQPSPKLGPRHLKALLVLLSWARSPERFDDWFLVSEEQFYHITIGAKDGKELLIPLLRSWVRTSRHDDVPAVSQFAAIAVLKTPPGDEYNIRFCDEMVPVLQAFYAEIYRDHGLHPNTPVLKFT